ncbi:MAG: hypothetical protein RBG13Loki_3800 [Promethearchaeota archaeon CR_4]|nr:MAG: hypothetical protein RBG13Loki_3800 [Candidatus Lokiarchaeota archaeon CR_4]
MGIQLDARSKTILIIAVIAASGFLAIALPITVIAADSKPISLSFTGSDLHQNFTFAGNDSRAISYELSIPAGKQVNITFTNKNGTRLFVTVSRTIAISHCGFSMDYCDSVLDPNTFPVSSPYTPEDLSVIFTALVATKLCISVQATAKYSAIPRWSETGGSIWVRETGDYPTTPIAPTTHILSDVNMSITDTMEYIREFSVDQSGYYLFNSTATPSEGVDNPSTDIQVLLKGTGPAFTVNSHISGAISEIGRLEHQGGIPTSTVYTTVYLEKGKTYMLRYWDDGFVNFTRWDLINTVQGVLGATGVTLNFAASPSTTMVFSPDPGLRCIFVDFGTLLKYNVLYDISYSGDPFPGFLYAGAFPEEDGMQVSLAPTYAPYLTSSHNAQLLLLEDTCEPMTIEGQRVGRTHGYISMVKDDIGWGNTSLGPVWGSDSIKNEWNLQHQLFAVWFQNSTTVPLPTSVKLSVSEHSGGVPALPATGTSLTFRNDGAEVTNGNGLYKITGHRDSELQIQFTSMGTLYDPGPIFAFVTQKGFRGAMVSTGDTYFSFSNTSRTWGGSQPSWDTPIVFEVALTVDPVYVIIIIDNYDTGAVSNTTAITMSYEYEPFLAINTPFTVSRDNQMQVFKPMALPASGMIQAYVEYGSCCNEVEGTVFVGMTCPCVIEEVVGVEWDYYSDIPNVKAWPGSPTAYVIWLYEACGGVRNGVVLRINIWSGAPFDWLPWGLFIGVAAVLGVIGVMFWKKKFTRA